MDFLFEWLIQLVIEVVGQLFAELVLESFFRGVAHTLASRVGRIILGAGAGLGFGILWGTHLSGHAHWPRLLWVSIALGVSALIAAIRSAPADRRGFVPQASWRDLLSPPWRWTRERFIGFAAINAGLAAGIALSFSPA